MKPRWADAGRYFLLRTDPDGTRHISWRVWVLVWVLPVCFLGAALFLALQTLWIRENTIETTGTVVQVYEWDNDAPKIFYPGEKVYSPVYLFTDETGREVRATAGMSHTRWNFPVGTEKTIRFFPGAEGDVVLAGPMEWALAQVITAIGISLVPLSLLGSIVLIFWRRAGGAPGTI